jgi:hypothetical protein
LVRKIEVRSQKPEFRKAKSKKKIVRYIKDTEKIKM